MNEKDDKKIDEALSGDYGMNVTMQQKIAARRAMNSVSTLPTAQTLADVIREAKRRSRIDGHDRIIYMYGCATVGIRLVGELKTGDQTTLYHINHNGKVTPIGKG
jgi:hypothetical protein